jgi:predicted PurR-regulated permease PerM
LRDEWLTDSLAKGLTAAKDTPAYQEQFRTFYNQRRESTPQSIPYTYEQYVELSKARPQGRKVFGDAVEKMDPSPQADRETRLRADFEAAKKHELFQEWWGGNSTARFIRHEVESSLSSGGSDRAERMLTSLLGVPGDICSALLLSFLICVDFPRLRLGILALRETWLKDGFDELAAPLSDLGKLMGRAMQAQAMIALCNAMLVFAALTVLNVEHAGLLALAVFILCQVPTLGMMLAWVLLTGVALIVPGGGMTLALKVTGAVIIIVLLETFVFSPRILGRMMELHPVLIMAILPLAQFFFGIWGLLLATPVAVYVVHVLILRHGLPGMSAVAKPALAE